MADLRFSLPLYVETTYSCHKRAPDQNEELIYYISYLIVSSLWMFPKERIDGYAVPTIIFKGQPKTFQAFLIAIMAAFSSAFLTLHLRGKHPNVAAYSRKFANYAMVVTILIPLWAAAWCKCFGK